MAEWCFFGGLAMLGFTYGGYPLLLAILYVVMPRSIRLADVTPTVTVLITAYNEESSISEKIRRTLEIDYPRDRLEIIVASDGSTDRTDEVVRSFAASGVRLNRVEGRRGKTAAQNATVPLAHGEIVVFTDATTVLDRQALRRIVRNFADPRTGCVGGRLVYRNSQSSDIGKGGVSYWQFERWIKILESKVNSLIGVSGCFYAIRKELYEDVPPGLISDFVVALNTFEKGYRVVYEDEAISYEDTLSAAEREFRMRVRVAIRSYVALFAKRNLLNPLRHGLYAVQLISHKLLRYMAPLLMLQVMFANLFLLDRLPYLIFFIAQCGFYGAGLAGHWFHKHGRNVRALTLPYYFVLANTAALVALVRFLRGERMVTWEPIR
jgi:cellulose synthase/poly-beta-1,6-N-acetylglucosamine synthase-like glycosyltransferase